MARAQIRCLDEGDLVSQAIFVVYRALREYPEGTAHSEEVSVRVQRRVWQALDDAGKKERKRRKREPLLDDLMEEERPVDVGDDEALARAAGVGGLVLASPEDSVLQHEPQAHLDREVERLAPAERHLYVLRHRQGLTWDDISSETRTPARTLRWQDRRIRDRLTAALRALDGEGA
jgi:RNA polymerase sigma factor (sigma-70 family)